MGRLIDAFQQTLGQSLPNILGAVAILIVGWLLAMAIRAGLRKALGAARLDERLGKAVGTPWGYEKALTQLVFVILLLGVALAFFNVLQLTQVSKPLESFLSRIMEYLPQIGAALVLVVVAFILASLARAVVRRALGKTSVDAKVPVHESAQPFSESLASAIYWLVFLIFLPPVLNALGMRGMLEPVENVTSKILSILPNALAAFVLGFVGWIVARIVRDITTNVAVAVGVDKLASRAGADASIPLSRVVGHVFYILILVPAIISALGALRIDTISDPATSMLQTLLGAIPALIAATLILTIAWFVARLAGQLLATLLAGLRLDSLPQALGMNALVREGTPLSKIAGQVFAFFVMLFAMMEAANQLNFQQFSEVVEVFLQFGGQVLLGTVIILIGVWLANLAKKTMVQFSGLSASIAEVVRFGILGLVLAMGLRAMGLADEIVTLAFGLTLGAVAVAFALSFGLGAREAAGRLASHWLDQLRNRPGN
ncbi:MAG: mechanosensitive ion channel [Candidatus Eisenbacteria bacterium]|uniref:Mechanosensitive ion channel n=1 Tax=Eiseniibacteriota bacterium TaxID=2212470 RepID=A0A7Y2E7R4_UNCEI|nr:mechanosensitive ion channel [Candidatus Eisenbacteria bacterium]